MSSNATNIAKRVAAKLLSGGRSRNDRIRAQRSAFKSMARPIIRSGNVGFANGRVTTGPQGPELKQFDTKANGTTVSSTGLVVSLLSGLPQGTGSANRVGNRVLIKALYMKLLMFQPASNTGVNFGHWSIVLDKQPDGTTPSLATIYDNSFTSVPQLNVANLERFQVLAAGDIEDALAAGVHLGEYFSKFIKTNIGTRFADATGEAITNGIYFTVCTEAVIGNPIQVTYDIRTKFTDE